jgi:hypothetical protein
VSADPEAILRAMWNHAEPTLEPKAVTAIPQDIRDAIPFVVNSSFKTFRYLLPSQLLAKLANPARHTLALQARSQLPGSFDARSFCKRYIVQFDRQNARVLGGSDDPFVGNIARDPQIDVTWLMVGQRSGKGGSDLLTILEFAQAHPQHLPALLQLTLAAIAARLRLTKIEYPRPNRISATACKKMIADFIAARTGGRRFQAVAAALFDAIGDRFGLFKTVEVGHINKADAARGDVADLDCRNDRGDTVVSVEVKDRQLSVREVEDTLRAARDKGIAEIIYLIRGGVPPSEKAAFEQLRDRQFNAGHNVYEIDLDALLETCLILFGEAGRLIFLERIGSRVDTQGDLSDRQAWQTALEAV